MRARLPVLAIAVVAVAAVGCASTVQGTPHAVRPLTQPRFPTSTPSQPSAAGSSSTPASFPSTSAAPSSPASSGSLPVIGGVQFDRPSGFTKTNGLRLVDPMEAQYQAEFLQPPSEPATGKDALAVVLYDLPAGSRPATEQAQRAYLQRYNSAHQVSVTDGVQPKSIGGYPGFSVLADQPPDYHYFGYYVFGRTTLVAVSCQYDLHPSAVYAACGRLIGSMKFTS